MYEIPLSEAVKRTMYKVMKSANAIEGGFLCFKNRMILKAHFDPEECDKLLETLIINKENVLRYLKRKYIPTKIENGAWYPNQKCIQKATVKEDGSLYIHINKSEPHKIITDTFHVIEDLKSFGFEFDTSRIKYYISRVQIAYQDTLLYNELLKDFGYQIPAQSREYAKKLLYKYGRIEEVVKIKKRSIKRKFLRYYAKTGKITWEEVRAVIKNTDFSEHNVKRISKELRMNAKERGVKVDF